MLLQRLRVFGRETFSLKTSHVGDFTQESVWTSTEASKGIILETSYSFSTRYWLHMLILYCEITKNQEKRKKISPVDFTQKNIFSMF